MPIRFSQTQLLVFKAAIHTSALAPLVWIYYLAITDQILADPVEAVIHFTGMGALNLLLLTLCVSPIAKKMKWGQLINVRRLLGLHCFFYAVLHIANFFVFELAMDLSLFVKEVIKRPYIVLGATSFSILLAMAITSTKGWKLRLGRQWQSLHNGIYWVVILVTTHYLWSLKVINYEALIYLTLTVLALIVRWRSLVRWAQKRLPEV